MSRTVLVGALLSSLATAPASAVGGTATDLAVSLAYLSSHWGAGPHADLTGVDATGDQLYQAGAWYRAQGDTREYALPPPDSETYAGGEIVAVWNNLHGKGLRLAEYTYVIDGEGPSGGFVSWFTVRNDNAAPLEFTLFHYLDPDLAATAGGDAAVSVTPTFIELNEGATRLAYRAYVFPARFQVGAYATLRDLLNDSAVTTLDNTGLPFGPGNATAAFQFGPRSLSPGTSYGLGPVSVLFNRPHRHVKGDFVAAGLPALYAQPSDLSNRAFVWMRRTGQCGPWNSMWAPTARSSLAGVDDFDGDLVDESVYRDTATGVTYVGEGVVSGAPTLPLNWQLSATGDFDGDGRADLLWRNVSSLRLVIWTMNGNAKVGYIIPTPDHAVDANWEVAAAIDFDGDGHRDLLWYNQTTGRLVQWLMDAAVARVAGRFTSPTGVGDRNWRALAAGDYGKGPGGVYDTQDIVWQNDTSKRVVVWHMDLAGNRTGGTFTSPDTLVGGWNLVGPR